MKRRINKYMKKMTLNTLDKILSTSPTKPNTILFEVDGEMINIEVKPFISLQEISDIVDASVQAAFTESGYSPEYKEAVFKYKIIDTLTNIPALKTKDTVDLVRYNEIYDRLGLEDRLGDMNDYVHNLMIDLRTMISDKLNFQKALMANRDGEIVDAVVGFFNTLNNTVNKYSENMKDIDIAALAPAIMELSKNKLDKNAIQTILEVGSASKVSPTLEVVK
jgi:hypothetical protein